MRTYKQIAMDSKVGTEQHSGRIVIKGVFPFRFLSVFYSSPGFRTVEGMLLLPILIWMFLFHFNSHLLRL